MSAKFAIKKLKISLVFIAVFIITIYLIYKFTATSLLFVFSIFSFIVMYYQRGLLDEIEEELKKIVTLNKS
jgi:hypothetical protein